MISRIISKVSVLCSCVALLASNAAARAELSVSHTAPRLLTPEVDPIPAEGSLPAVAASADVVLVAYADADRRVVARLFGLDGVALGIPFDIAPLSNAMDVRVGFDGSAFVVGWFDWSANVSNLYVRRVSTSGELLGDAEDLGPVTTDELASFAIGSGEGGALVLACAWLSSYACRTWSVGEAGASAVDQLPFDTDTYHLSLARSGDTMLGVMWGQVNTLYTVRLTAGGTFLDDALVPLASGSGIDNHPAAVGTDTGFAVIWSESPNQMVSDVTFAGAISTRAPLHSGWIARPEVLALPDGFLVVGDGGHDGGDSPAYMRMRHYTKAWVPADESLLIGMGSNDVTTVGTLAGTAPFVVWDNVLGELVGRLVDPSATEVTGDATVVSARLPAQTRPRAAPGPGGYLVMWSEWPRIRARRVDAAGLSVGETFTVTEQASPDGMDVSGGPSGWLLAWTIAPNAAHVAHVGADGRVSEPVDLVGFGGVDARQQLARSSDGWLLGYTEHGPLSSYDTVRGARFDDEGRLLETQSLWSNPTSEWHPLDVIGGASGYELYWLTYDQLWKADVSNDGQALEPLDTGISAPSGRWISVATGTSGLRLLWRTSEEAFFQAGQSAPQPLGRSSFSELVNVGDETVLASTGDPAAAAEPITISAEQNGALVALDTIPAARTPELSTAADGRMMLSMVREERVQGAWTTRVYTSVVTLEGTGTDGGRGGTGGQGGTSGQGGTAGQSGNAGSTAGGEGGRDDDSGGGPNQGGNTSDGGRPSDGGEGATTGGNGGAQAGAQASSRASRAHSSSGCGCRSSGSAAHGHWLALILLVMIRRRLGAARLRSRAS